MARIADSPPLSVARPLSQCLKGPAAGPFAGAAVAAGQPFFNGFNLSGANGGGYGGCDYQFGAWVVGVEGDWSIENKSGQAGPTVNTIIPGTLTTAGFLGGPPRMLRRKSLGTRPQEAGLATPSTSGCSS